MRNRPLHITTVARILHLMPSDLPGSVMRSHARDLGPAHHREPCKTMRDTERKAAFRGKGAASQFSHGFARLWVVLRG